jgi:malate dehydrogenase (oxaloacetate-decarboxylating)(NADP+)
MGIGDLIVDAMVEEGSTREAAISRCWFMDSKGLVESGRKDLQDHKKLYAHKFKPIPDLLTAVKELKPTALIGVSGRPGQFSKEIIEAMASFNKRPVIFALSNPTANSECTAEEAYRWSEGRAVFASGSPFAPVVYNGTTFVPGQGNNAYIFPGIGLGILASGSTRATNEMFSHAAKTLAQLVTDEDIKKGCLYPPLTKIREISAHIAKAVAEVAYARGFARVSRPADLLRHVRSHQYQPVYKKYV